jgi:trehalose 6-phosphate phosphatase
VLWPEAAPFQEQVAVALDEIEATLAPCIPGLWMERKGITGGVHWRLTQDHAAAEGLALPIVTRIATAHGLRVRASKFAVELYPPVLTDKGAGLAHLIDTHGLHGVIYLGDDVSDSDAFKLVRLQRNEGKIEGLAIAVWHENAPTVLTKTADMLVAHVGDVTRVIDWLLAERRQAVSESD